MGILIFVVCAAVVIITIFGLVVARLVNIEASAEQHIIRDDSIAESILGKIHPSNIQWINDHSFVYHTAFELNYFESCVLEITQSLAFSWSLLVVHKTF